MPASQQEATSRAPARSYVELIIILGAMTAFAPLSIDMYLPAFPTLQESLGTTAGQIQLTLASFFIAFAGGQIIYGPLTDRYGRKKPVYVGLSLFVAASIGCAFAATVEQLIVLRFIQALGAGAGVVVARAMVRDLFPPSEAVAVFSRLMLVMGVAPMLAPLLGSYLLIWFDWHAIFAFLALVGALCLSAVFLRLPESLPPEKRQPLALRSIGMGYLRLLLDRRFIGPALVGGLSIAGMFVYITSSPFVFIEVLGISTETYGWLFGFNAFGFIASAQVNARLGRQFGPAKVLSVSTWVVVAAVLLLVLGGVAGIGGRYGVLVPVFVFIASLGFVMPNTAALAMAPFGRNAGSASALMGTLQFGLAAIASGITGSFEHQSPAPLALLVAGFGLAGFVTYYLLCRNTHHRQ